MIKGKDGGGETVETSSDIPERYRDFVDGNLAIAGTLSNRPYIPYQGTRVAGFTPDQMAAFGTVRNLGSSYQQPLNAAGAAYGAGLNSLAPLASSAASAYGAGLSALSPFANNASAAYTAAMNSAADPSVMMSRYQDPYTEQVIDATEADLNRSFDKSSEQARLSSPWGGSRLGIREGTIEGERARAIADVGSRLRSDAFRTAAGLGQNATSQLAAAGDRALGLGTTLSNSIMGAGDRYAGLGQGLASTYLGAGDRYAGLGGTALNLGGTYADMLAGIGAQQQGLNQAQYDINYGDFLEELNYPLTALSIRQSAIGQTPMGSVGRQPVVSQGGSGLGGLLSGAGSFLTGLKAAGAFCWVAREAYDYDPKWLKVREWMLTKAPASLRERYERIGPMVAEKIRYNPERKAEYRAVFDEILEAA